MAQWANRGGGSAREPDMGLNVLGERLRHQGANRLYSFREERIMGMGRGILLWLLGVPLPIVILLALFWHH